MPNEKSQDEEGWSEHIRSTPYTQGAFWDLPSEAARRWRAAFALVHVEFPAAVLAFADLVGAAVHDRLTEALDLGLQCSEVGLHPFE